MGVFDKRDGPEETWSVGSNDVLSLNEIADAVYRYKRDGKEP